MMKSLIFMKLMILISMSLFNILLNSLPSHNKNMHPILMSLILLSLSTLSSMNISILNDNHWFSYLMFLIIIGGLMIIFLYFTSFINNMKMTMKLNYLTIFPFKMLLMMIFIMMLFIYMNKYFMWFNNFLEINNFKMLMKNMNFFINNQSLYLYLFNKNFTTIISMIYLLMCLTFIVKFCMNKKLMLRKMN
nr:NADH dehydrogenase subunit 6 [Hyssopus sp. 1 HHL-2023a]